MNTVLSSLNLQQKNSGTFSSTWLNSTQAKEIVSYSPIDGATLGAVEITDDASYEIVLKNSQDTFLKWREYPAPKRGEIIRLLGQELRNNKEGLAHLITLECGKIYSESLGEVQEAIDIADFAVGLSRQLYGLTMHSERPNHRMYEQWHPLGPVAVITAFNFPLAVWAWNACIAAVCGDTIVWKPSELTPLIAVAATKIAEKITSQFGFAGVFSLVNGAGAEVGKKIAADKRFPLVSATGSTRMGREVGQVVAARLGKSLLELGGNNAVIVMEDADLNLVVDSIAFGAAGTTGQRCTTTRRVFVAESIADSFTKALIDKYKKLIIGNPLDSTTQIGPLINAQAVKAFEAAIIRVNKEGGQVLEGGNVIKDLYVEPTIVAATPEMKLVEEETFAPIVYVMKVKNIEQAIALQNAVPQGLSSALFSDSIKYSEYFLSTAGSDCGIANINIGTSGAEIGGAFGGEKDTGGGRESGSDSWKIYMRRQTNTINWGGRVVLAQGVKF